MRVDVRHRDKRKEIIVTDKESAALGKEIELQMKRAEKAEAECKEAEVKCKEAEVHLKEKDAKITSLEKQLLNANLVNPPPEKKLFKPHKQPPRRGLI